MALSIESILPDEQTKSVGETIEITTVASGGAQTWQDSTPSVTGSYNLNLQELNGAYYYSFSAEGDTAYVQMKSVDGGATFQENQRVSGLSSYPWGGCVISDTHFIFGTEATTNASIYASIGGVIYETPFSGSGYVTPHDTLQLSNGRILLSQTLSHRGRILYSDDGGVNWSTLIELAYNKYRISGAVQMSDGSYLFGVTRTLSLQASVVIVSSDGTTATEATLPSSGGGNDKTSFVGAYSNGTLWAYDNSNGNYWESTDNGASWVQTSSTLPQVPASYSYSNSANYLCSEDGLYKTEDNGVSWSTLFSASRVTGYADEVAIVYNANPKNNATRIEYQYNKDGSPIAGATSNPYTKTAEESDSGSYTCTVSDGVDTVTSNAVSVTVEAVNSICSNLPSQDTSLGITNLLLNPMENEEWDIVLCNGQIQTISSTEYVSQKAIQFLRTCKGEVFYDIDYGIPYLTSIIGVKNPNLSAIEQILITNLLENETLISLGVVDVTIESINLSSSSRDLTVQGLEIFLDEDESVLIGEVVL